MRPFNPKKNKYNIQQRKRSKEINLMMKKPSSTQQYHGLCSCEYCVRALIPGHSTVILQLSSTQFFFEKKFRVHNKRENHTHFITFELGSNKDITQLMQCTIFSKFVVIRSKYKGGQFYISCHVKSYDAQVAFAQIDFSVITYSSVLLFNVQLSNDLFSGHFQFALL